jgi:hypothetical protein
MAGPPYASDVRQDASPRRFGILAGQVRCGQVLAKQPWRTITNDDDCGDCISAMAEASAMVDKQWRRATPKHPGGRRFELAYGHSATRQETGRRFFKC